MLNDCFNLIETTGLTALRLVLDPVKVAAGRISSVLYRFISELIVLRQINLMLKPLKGFSPKMRRFFMEISDVYSKTPDEPKLFSTPRHRNGTRISMAD